MFKYRSQKQLSIFDFYTDFESQPDPDNRWVKMAKLLDWDKLAEFMPKVYPHRWGRQYRCPHYYWSFNNQTHREKR